MNVATITLAYLRARPLATALHVLLLALGVATITVLLLVLAGFATFLLGLTRWNGRDAEQPARRISSRVRNCFGETRWMSQANSRGLRVCKRCVRLGR